MILVTGISGQLGQAILRHLKTRGADVTGGTRNPDGSTHARTLNFDDPQTLALDDVATLVFVSAGTAEDDVVIARHQNLITAAEKAGVAHIIYTSLADHGDHLGFALAHRWTERRLQEGSIPWTILRNGLYAELIGQLLTPDEGVITAPLGNRGVAAIARQDLAEAAANIALAPQKHAGRIYNLAAMRAISAQQVADQVGANYQPGTLSELRKSLAAADLLPFQPDMLVSIHSAASFGFLESTTDTIASLLNRAPLDPLQIAANSASQSS
ncbi:NmrA family NAD(P)-binding protein [Arthrobacter sp. ISL-65]|uniref:NAD(P)H-binding protein n=1 Tax=Arthrobacter sp. ISL-65 TaxID=2819112 RepID=UPI001BECDF75|nr:NmrA family NAD(P)-binding protein [Arthrobacter sp. ISL-65]MBT2548965.1 NmrA family NAD(P)-binding protein [Arthrobacter sp. ISL-65]